MRLGKILAGVLFGLIVGVWLGNEYMTYTPAGAPTKGLWRQSPLVRKIVPDFSKKVYTLIVGAPKPLNAMSLVRNTLIPYTFVFEGKALYHDVPCPNAGVLVTIFTPHGTLAKGGTTDADGSYRIEMAIKANANDAMDWQMQAYTPEFKKVELVGRKIITEDSSTSIDNTVAFLPQEAAQ
jgi:hypothetical protein